MRPLVKLLVFGCLYLTIGLQPAAGQSRADSLRTLLSLTLNDSVYVDLLNKLSKEFRYSNPTVAMDYAVKAEKLAETNHNESALALAYHNIAAIYADKQNNELATEYYFRCLRLNEKNLNKQGAANAYDNIGLIYRRQRNFEVALEFHNKSLKLKKELNDSIGIAYSYENIGLVYNDQGKYDKALIQFYNSLRLKESMNDKYGMANSYGNIGIVYLKIGSIEQSKVNLEKGLELFEELNNTTGIAEALLYLGDIYEIQEENQKAIDAYQRCLEIYTAKGNMKGMADSYQKLGDIYATIGYTKVALENLLKSLEYYTKVQNDQGVVNIEISLGTFFIQQSDYAKARQYLIQAMKLAKQQKLIAEENTITQLLAEIAMNQKDYAQSAELLMQSKKLSDTLFNNKLIKEVTKVQMQYEFDKKTKEREFEEAKARHEQELKMKRMGYMRNMALLGAFLLAILVLVLLRHGRVIKQKNELLEEQQKRISEQMNTLFEQRNKLQKANETKDKFISIIGHDLRNPLNAINGFINLILENEISPSSELFNRYMTMLKESGNNAQSLLENLLEWALTQSGEMEMKPTEVSLNYIIRGNVLLIKEQAAQKKIELIENLQGNPVVFIDKNMINTVVRNLLSNALKYTNPEGTITIKTELFQSFVNVVISDTGIGMTPQQVIDIFDPTVTKKTRDGVSTSGLGLILCKDFLQEHRQELRVKSAVNEGTTFWFSLPLSENRL